jgi:predicted dehydrogenase
MIATGLVGFGNAARIFHAPVIRAVEGLELKAIVQRSGNSARELYPDVRVVPDLADLLADDSIRLIVIATPNPTHFALARTCLLAGRDVVVDKPFTTTVQEADELIRIAGESKCLLTVHQNRRWDGDFRTVQKLLAEGPLGNLVLFESHYDRYRPELRPGAWRERKEPGSGILFDLGSHLIDQAVALFGVPNSMTGEVRRERAGAEVDDAFDLVLHYAEPLRVILRATMLACAPGPRFTLQGTSGSFTKFGMDPQEEELKAGKTPGGPGWGKEPESHWGTLTTCGPQGPAARQVPTEPGDYRLFYENVRDAILGIAAPAVTLEQAGQVMRLIEQASSL